MCDNHGYTIYLMIVHIQVIYSYTFFVNINLCIYIFTLYLFINGMKFYCMIFWFILDIKLIFLVNIN